MGKYSEDPLDNLVGYLEDFEIRLERMEKQQKELSAAASKPSDNSEINSLKEQLASIRADVDGMRKENSTISKAMNTVAEAIGTVPTEEKRNKQHQQDLQFVVDTAKKQITVSLDADTNMNLHSISQQVRELNGAMRDANDSFSSKTNQTIQNMEARLDKIGDGFAQRIEKTTEKKEEKALHNVTASVIENWCWRGLALIGLIAWCLTWLYPKIKDIEFPNGVEGFFYTVMGVLLVITLLYGIFQWGKSSRGWY